MDFFLIKSVGRFTIDCFGSTAPQSLVVSLNRACDGLKRRIFFGWAHGIQRLWPGSGNERTRRGIALTNDSETADQQPFLKKWLGTLGGFAAGLGLMALVLVSIGNAVAAFYIPVRLHFIGTVQDVTVVSCDPEIVGHEGGYRIFQVSVDGFDQQFPVADFWNCDLKAGDKVKLLFSHKLDKGVILPGGQSLLHVIYHFGHGVSGVIFAAFCWLLVAATLLVRSVAFVVHLGTIARQRYQETFTGKDSLLARLRAVTEFGLDLSFVFMTVCLVVLTTFIMLKGIVYVESAPAPVTGAAIFFLCIVFVSPLLERMVDALWRLREGSALTIVRNIIGSVLFVGVSLKMIRFVANEDFRTYQNVRELVSSFFESLL